MSAFICSFLHIKSLAIFATQKTGRQFSHYTKSPEGQWVNTAMEEFPLVYLNFSEHHDLSNPTTVARILMTENIKSVCARYNEDEDKYYWHELNVDVTPTDISHFHTLGFTPVQLIKLIHCLDYQSREHGEWDGSLARKILAALEDHLIIELPGYQDAPWGIDDDYQPGQRPKTRKPTHS